MVNKIQTVSAVTAVGLSSLGLYICRRRLSSLIWNIRSNLFLKSNKNIFIINSSQNWDKIYESIQRDICAINAVGFDCEWVSTRNGRRPVALMQLATYSGNCVMFRLSNFDKDIPQSLIEILENKNIVKVGVGPDLDALYLLQDYNIKVNGWLDLRHLAMEAQSKNGKTDESSTGEGLGLQTLAYKYLGKKLEKNWRVSTSNWESPELTPRQIAYASEDALVGIQILLAQLKIVWSPDSSWPPFSLRAWAITTAEAVRSICSPFSDLKFNQNKRQLANGSSFKRRGDSSAPQKPSKESRLYHCTRKSPLYHNSLLQAPDGEPLCTCDPKKLYWYVEKGLGVLESEDPLVVRLKFEPAGRPIKEGDDGMFYLQERYNICVVCGKEESYIRKNIIPHEYRKYFPTILKSHQSHDVVLLCTECHKVSNIKDNTLRYSMSKEFDAPIGCETDVKLTIDGRLKAIRSAGGALLRSRSHLPPERIEHLESILKKFYNTETLDDELITQAAVLDTQIMNDSYTPHGLKVYQYYKCIGLIKLEERWREWFLDSMQPEYLPDNWSVSHNHKKLRLKMSRYPLTDMIREDYKVALVGTEGTIDVPYVPEEKRSNFFGLSKDEEMSSRESTPEETLSYGVLN